MSDFEDVDASTPSIGMRNNIPVRGRPRGGAIPMAASVRARMVEATGAAPKTLNGHVWARIVDPRFLDMSHSVEAALQSVADRGFSTAFDFLSVLDRDIGLVKIERDSMDFASAPDKAANLAVRMSGMLLAHAIVLEAWYEQLERDPDAGEQWEVAS